MSAKKSPGQKPAVRVVREFSAGGVIWRRTRDGSVAVALVKPAGKEAWTLPKGQVEPGEHLKDTAVRECREETGLEVAIGEKLGDISYVYSRRGSEDGGLTRIFKRVAYYLMEYKGGEPRPQPDEIAEVRWFPMERAIEVSSYANERALIEKASAVVT